MHLALRVRGAAPETLAGRLREITMALDGTLRLHEILPLDEVYRQDRMGLYMGALALALVTLSVVLLSTAGIYALMSFTVSQRRREIGIRTALGAEGCATISPNRFARRINEKHTPAIPTRPDRSPFPRSDGLGHVYLCEHGQRNLGR